MLVLLDLQDPGSVLLKIERLENFELGAFRIDGHEIDLVLLHLSRKFRSASYPFHLHLSCHWRRNYFPLCCSLRVVVPTTSTRTQPPLLPLFGCVCFSIGFLFRLFLNAHHSCLRLPTLPKVVGYSSHNACAIR